jgi:IS4 transposase
VAVTDGKTHDVTMGRTLDLPADSIVVMDRAYTDYTWFNALNSKGIFFVTRQKRNASYRVTERHEVLKSKGLTCDQTILITGTKAKVCPTPLRRIGYRDPETGKHYVFLTNNFHLAAKTIADIYKARWQIELFFKCIKQNLKIKSFVGTSRNAVLTQIWIAMCTYLLLAWIKFSSGIERSLQQMVRLLQLNLFDRRDLLSLLRGNPPDPPPGPQQIRLRFL